MPSRHDSSKLLYCCTAVALAYNGLKIAGFKAPKPCQHSCCHLFTTESPAELSKLLLLLLVVYNASPATGSPILLQHESLRGTQRVRCGHYSSTVSPQIREARKLLQHTKELLCVPEAVTNTQPHQPAHKPSWCCCSCI